MDIEKLINKHVISAQINEEKDVVVLNTTTGLLYLKWDGDCCANCYLAHVSGADALVDATILDAENSEWVIEREDDWEVVESMGTKIKTTKGYVTFESRVEHNGYYSGYIEVEKSMGKLSTLMPLTDF